MNIAALQQENAELNATVANLTSELNSLKQQLDCFQRQLFGRKLEKRLAFDAREQGNLLFGLGVEAPPEKDDIPTATVVIHSTTQIELIHNIHHKSSQMLLRKPIQVSISRITVVVFQVIDKLHNI